MDRINPFSYVPVSAFTEAADKFQTPCYLYDERLIKERCRQVLDMPNAYGLTVRYAMKANSNRRLLQIIHKQGVAIDASSLNEALRAHLAGIPCDRIILTSQEIPLGEARTQLEGLLQKGMKYNVCSLRQLHLIGAFAKAHNLSLSMRVHPGTGAGESASRNTGDEYSCFGIHLSDLPEALNYAGEMDIPITQMHVHIGSGGDPEMWRQNIDLELSFMEQYFPDADTVSFGGGLKEARMPDETAADIAYLGNYAAQKIEEFYRRTGRKLHMEVEPGTYFLANSGYAVTTILDHKKTGASGFDFLILDGGMDINTRPALYGSRHPFYVISREKGLLSSDFDTSVSDASSFKAVVVGNCCESGDCQTLDGEGNIVPRPMARPEIGDLIVIGGAGAYCASMSPFNYNSHLQIPEVLYSEENKLCLIRQRQTIEQLLQNEL